MMEVRNISLERKLEGKKVDHVPLLETNFSLVIMEVMCTTSVLFPTMHQQVYHNFWHQLCRFDTSRPHQKNNHAVRCRWTVHAECYDPYYILYFQKLKCLIFS